MINLAVLKFFIDDRNSFSIEEWKSLGLQQNSSHAPNDEEKVISQNNEEVKTDSLYMTLNTTPEVSLNEIQAHQILEQYQKSYH